MNGGGMYHKEFGEIVDVKQVLFVALEDAERNAKQDLREA